MNETSTFVTGIALTLAVSLLIVSYLRLPLRSLLTELCGTLERAKFWTSFSIVTLVCVPLIFALQFHPETDFAAGNGFVLSLARQLKWVLIGVVVTVMILGMVVGAFIPKRGPAREMASNR